MSKQQHPKIKALSDEKEGLSNPVFATNPLVTGFSKDLDKNFVNDMKKLAVTTVYKRARLHIPEKDSATWFVFWYNFNPAKQRLERVRKTFNLNRIEDISQRRYYGTLYVELINRALSNGGNIFQTDAQVPLHIALQPNYKEFQTIEAALRYALNRQLARVKPRSANSYRSVVNIFIKWLQKHQLTNLAPGELSPRIIHAYMDERQGKGINAKTINTHNSYLHLMYEFLRKMGEVEVNPFKSIDSLPETDTERFEILTPEELQRISTHLNARNPDFALYTKLIYYAAIRPYHIGQYQAQQFDFEHGVIHTKGSTSKNRKNQQKQMIAPLQQALIRGNRHTIPGDWYLFGKDFKPSQYKYNSLSTRAAELWKKLVHEELGINKQMYALKHTAAQMYLNNADNPDVGWLQQQMEHHSLEETDIYVKRRKVKKVADACAALPKY